MMDSSTATVADILPILRIVLPVKYMCDWFATLAPDTLATTAIQQAEPRYVRGLIFVTGYTSPQWEAYCRNRQTISLFDSEFYDRIWKQYIQGDSAGVVDAILTTTNAYPEYLLS